MIISDTVRSQLAEAGVSADSISALELFSEADGRLALQGILAQDTASSEALEDVDSDEAIDAPESADAPAEPEAAEQTPPAQLNIFQRAAAQLQSREHMAAEIQSLRARVAELESENADIATALSEVEAEAAQGRELAEKVAELEQREQTVSQQAAAIAAASHLDADDLPEASEDAPQTLAELREQIVQCKDPKEKGRLARQARVLRDMEASRELN